LLTLRDFPTIKSVMHAGPELRQRNEGVGRHY
jgi:hypothetical protein